MAQKFKFIGEEYSKEELAKVLKESLLSMKKDIDKRHSVYLEAKELLKGGAIVENSYEINMLLNLNKELADFIASTHKRTIERLKDDIKNHDIAHFAKMVERDVEKHQETLSMLDLNIADILNEEINQQILMATINNDMNIMEFVLDKLQLQNEFVDELSSSREDGMSL